MDNRKAQCKFLKKEYRALRRRATWFWVTLWCLGLAAALLAGVGYACARFYESPFLESIRKLLDLSTVLKYESQLLRFAPWVALGGAAVWLIAWIGWGCASRRTRKSAAYLDWRTVKTALEAEKEEKR